MARDGRSTPEAHQEHALRHYLASPVRVRRCALAIHSHPYYYGNSHPARAQLMHARGQAPGIEYSFTLDIFSDSSCSVAPVHDIHYIYCVYYIFPAIQVYIIICTVYNILHTESLTTPAADQKRRRLARNCASRRVG